MSEGEEDDIELQRALALSLQQHDPPSNVIAVEEETTQQQQQQKQRPPPPVATKNLPAFDPTDREISDCFQELSRHRTTFTASDLVHTGSKLGLELDHRKATAMTEYLIENNILPPTNASITLQQFKEIVEHFRVVQAPPPSKTKRK